MSRPSKIWTFPTEELKKIVEECEYSTHVIKRMGMTVGKRTLDMLFERLEQEGIQHDHLLAKREDRSGWSRLYKLPAERLWEAVRDADCMVDVLRSLNLSNGGRTIKILRKRLDRERIDYRHLIDGKKLARGALPPVPTEKVLKRHCFYRHHLFLEKVHREKLVENRCASCGLKPRWKGKKLNLLLDHKNGIVNDNRIKNLRFLCPNCKRQIEDARKQRTKKKQKLVRCITCGQFRSPRVSGQNCQKCRNKTKEERVERDKQRAAALKPLLEAGLSYFQAGKQIGLVPEIARKVALAHGLKSRYSRK